MRCASASLTAPSPAFVSGRDDKAERWLRAEGEVFLDRPGLTHPPSCTRRARLTAIVRLTDAERATFVHAVAPVVARVRDRLGPISDYLA